MANLKFAVLGTGNSGQCFSADIALKGYSVNLAEIPEFSANLEAIEMKGGIEITGQASCGFAKMNMITTNLKKAIEGVHIIFIGGSAYAHEPFSLELAEYFDRKNLHGVLIARIEDGSPADKAGFETDDLIVGVDGVPVKNVADLRIDISSRRPGAEVKFTVLRDGKEVDLTAELGRVEEGRLRWLEGLRPPIRALSMRRLRHVPIPH